MPRLLKRTTRILLITLLILASGVFLFFKITTKVTKHLDPYAYELPFNTGASFRVVQGYGGLFSHRQTAALDFAMPEGTPVLAARGGTVYAYRDQSNEGGIWGKYKNKANYIMIRHDDGSYGCYWHLKQNGVLIKSGRVKQGQTIGLSGATGQVIRPHLHFSVKRILGYQKDSYIRTKFRTGKGVILLKHGKVYQRPG